MEYSTYLFDFDYTLADSSRGIVMCFRNVLTRHGHIHVTDEEIKRTIGKTLEDSFSVLTGIADKETLAAYKKEYVKEADTHMTPNTVLFPETVAVLQTLKKRGAKIGIISTKFRYRIREMLDQHFAEDFFDVIIGGEDVKHAKPHPQGLKKALRRLHRTRKETLYIGDSTVDAETALRAKVDFVGVLNGMTTREELAAYPHRQILDSLSLLPLVERFSPYAPAKYCLPKLTACLRLLRQKQIQGKQEPKETDRHHVCKNCGKAFRGNHCPHCGQTADTPRFTIKNAFQNILSGFFNIDNGFSRNLLELLYRPGYMIRDYLRGKRVHYFKPFQTLFVLAALYIMSVQLFDPEALKKAETEESQEPAYGEVIHILKQKSQDAANDTTRHYLDKSIAYVDSARTSEERITSDERLAHELIKIENGESPDGLSKAMNVIGDVIGKQWGETEEKPFKENAYFTAVANLMKSWIHGNKAFSIIAFLPILTLFTRWSFRRTPIGRRMNLTENFFAQVYIACQILWISILVLPFTRQAHLDDIFDLSYTAIFALFVWDYRQLFGVSWKQSFWHTTAMLWNCLLAIVIISAAIVGIIVLAAYVTAWWY